MLKQRVLTALLLLPLALAAIFLLPGQWFSLLIALILLAGSREYIRLAGLSGFAAYMLPTFQAVIFIFLFLSREHWDQFIFTALVAACAAWLLMFVRLTRYRPGYPVNGNYRLASFFTAIASISTGWFAICWIHSQPQGPWLILLLLLIVWAADTGAYFSGRLLGKRKLAPKISPGKTRAGLIGGLVTAPLVALLTIQLTPVTPVRPLEIILLALATALVSVGGDLLISMHKRTTGFKDSGNLLPGHGGILDRLDSLLVAAPFFALGLLLIGV